jgi:NitT/TauT family transport system permease protein
VPAFVSDPSVYVDIWVTFRRVLGALAVSIFVGTWAAFAMARGGFAGSIVSRYVSLTLGVPSTIAALLALFIFKRSEIGVYVVVAVVTFPFVTVILYQGLKAVDRKLTEMVRVYRFSSLMRVRHLFLPYLVPYTFAALRNEYAHAWKVVVLAELFAVNTGMGYRFAQAFDRFLLVDVMLWLFVFMIILLGTEYLILLPLEKLVTRWRSS